MSQISGRPLIGIVANSERVIHNFVEVIDRNGGESHGILTNTDSDRVDQMSNLMGLIVSGEDGVSIKQFKLLESAIAKDVPVLCVGAGMDALNQVFGGGIGNDDDAHGVYVEDGDRKSSYHRIYITPGSKLASVVGSGGFVRVNSRHSRVIKEAQKSSFLMAAAYSLEDGVIEALESHDHHWVIGVQFSPEHRLEIPPHFERLFRTLVERSSQ